MATVTANSNKASAMCSQTIAVQTFVFAPMEVVAPAHEADKNIADGDVKRFANAGDMIRSLRNAARKAAKK